MKQTLVKIIAVAIIVILGVNLYNGVIKRDLTDEEIMCEYISEFYGDTCYGKIMHGHEKISYRYTDNYENFIDFNIYDKDQLLVGVSIDREFYNQKYK